MVSMKVVNACKKKGMSHAKALKVAAMFSKNAKKRKK